MNSKVKKSEVEEELVESQRQQTRSDTQKHVQNESVQSFSMPLGKKDVIYFTNPEVNVQRSTFNVQRYATQHDVQILFQKSENLI